MRLDKLLSQDDFSVIEQVASDYINNVLGTEVWLYSIDRSETPKTGAFQEALSTELHFFDPVKIPSIIEFRPPSNKAYEDNGVARYEENGNLVFHVLNMDINRLQRPPQYGDFVAYEIMPNEFFWFKIVNNNKKNFNNEKTWGSMWSLYRSIECVPVDKSELTFVK